MTLTPPALSAPLYPARSSPRWIALVLVEAEYGVPVDLVEEAITQQAFIFDYDFDRDHVYVLRSDVQTLADHHHGLQEP